MEMIKVSVADVDVLTRIACENGRPDWDARINLYWRAYNRRLARERERVGSDGPASSCLMALSGRMVDVVQ